MERLAEAKSKLARSYVDMLKSRLQILFMQDQKDKRLASPKDLSASFNTTSGAALKRKLIEMLISNLERSFIGELSHMQPVLAVSAPSEQRRKTRYGH